MHLYEGKIYKDDRIFILDLTPAKKKERSIWVVVTRRNYDGFPPFRTNEFKTKEEAISFIKKIEPTTPCISFSGKSPKLTLAYEDYCKSLRDQGVPSAMEIYELNKNTQREIILDEL